MKKTLPILLIFLLLLLSSCATTEKTSSFVSSDGIRVFMRPVRLNGDIPIVLDMTIPTEKSRIIGNGAVNYSILTEKGGIKDLDSVFLTFLLENESFNTEANEFLFQEGKGRDEIEIRFTSSLPLESLEAIMEGEMINVSLSADGQVFSLDSQAFVSSLSDVKNYIL